jgi:hypothetical protein
MHLPGNRNWLVQFLWNNKEQSHQAACDEHEYVKNPGKPGCRFLCVPETPEFSCYPRTEVLEHILPYPVTMTGSNLNYPDSSG